MNGFPASFSLAYSRRLAVHGHPPYGFQDMTLLEPTTCPAASFRYSDAVISARPALTPLGGAGRFPLGSFGVTGSLTGGTAATLRASYQLLAEPGGPAGCSGTLVWRMRPAHRRAVADGTWAVRFSDGETSTFTVGTGGRLVTGIASPGSAPGCGGQMGGADVFIAANGTAGFVEPGGFTISLAFAGTTASGTLTFGSACAVTLTATLAKRST